MVLPRPPLTSRKAPEGREREQHVKSPQEPTRRRDLRSAVSRVAALLDEEPAHLPLEFDKIAARLATINPVAVGMTAKTLANVRSDFLAAVRHSGLLPVLD